MKRKKKIRRLSIRAKYWFLFLTALCVGLLVLSFRYSQQFDSFHTAVNEFFAPGEKFLSKVETFLDSKVQHFRSMEDLIEENAALKDQLDEVSADNLVLSQEKEELRQLRELFDLDATYGDYPKVAARVIYKDSGNWYHIFMIDKGTEDGITKGMNVISGGGLVGIVIESGKNYSKVRSIIDDQSSVDAMFSDTKETCIVNGSLALRNQGVMELMVELIDKNAPVSPGKELVTSNTSSMFLPGILIGYLSEYSVDPSNMTMSGYVTPAVDFSNLEMVLVITETKDSQELNDMIQEENK